MMTPVRLYQVFCDLANQQTGNTSTVVMLEKPLQDDRMQQLAADIRQPATTFLYPIKHQHFGVRWFAPDAEIEVCGHGAAAAIAFLSDTLYTEELFTLKYTSGQLSGQKTGNNTLTLQLPVFRIREELPISDQLKKGLGIPVLKHYATENKNIVEVETEEEVRNMKPDFATLRKDSHFGYIVTAPGNEADFVSRTFVPHVAQLEDPATGSSHATLTPFWSEKLNKKKLEALQLSERGGRFSCELKDEWCFLTGKYRMLMEGSLVPE